MFDIGVLKNLQMSWHSDFFSLIKYFSWIYLHWMGASLSFAVVFSASAVAGYLTIWLLFHHLSNMNSGEKTRTDVATAVHYFVIAIDALIVPFLVTIWMIRGHRRVHRVIKTFATVDEKLLKFGRYPSCNSGTRKFIILICAPMLTSGVYVWTDVNYNRLPSSKILILHSFFLHFHQFVTFYTLGFFASLVLLVGDRYKAVNSVLSELSQEPSCVLTNTRQIVAELITTTRELRAVHRKLFFAAEDIRLAFNFQILVLTIITLMSALGEMYNFYLASISPCGSQSLPPFAYLVLFSMEIFPVYVAAFSCSCTCDQAKRIAALMQEITPVDENLCLEIATFSLQLIHYDLSFTACGFFNVDLTLVETIVETISTYLIILIQIGTVPQNCPSSLDSGSDIFVNTSINRGSNIS